MKKFATDILHLEQEMPYDKTVYSVSLSYKKCSQKTADIPWQLKQKLSLKKINTKVTNCGRCLLRKLTYNHQHQCMSKGT